MPPRPCTACTACPLILGSSVADGVDGSVPSKEADSGNNSPSSVSISRSRRQPARTCGNSSGHSRQISSASPPEFKSSSSSASTRESSAMGQFATLGGAQIVQTLFQKQKRTIQASMNGFGGNLKQFSSFDLCQTLD